jgi:putative spermidine/putrescine transport system ATP-binding protein
VNLAAVAPVSPTGAPHLTVDGVAKRYRGVTVLEGLDFSVGQGEFVSLLGPSGCGKTTLLRIIAGLAPADGGSIALAGRDITKTPAHRRNIGVVFQNYALFPHLTVARNVAFGLEMQGTPKAGIAASVQEALRLVRMEDYAHRSVVSLSGGQQQRVAVARALATKPTLLLLDEPLSALDRKLRETMQIELRRLLREQHVTAVFVTHDQDEALVMSDRVAVMNQGRIEHFDTPAAVYSRPATPFVLDFVGSSLRLRGRVAAAGVGEVEVETAVGRVRAPGNFLVGSPVLVAVRPERIDLAAIRPGECNHLELTLVDKVYMGSRAQYLFATAGDDRAMVEAARPPEADSALARGTRVSLSWATADTLVYPAP